VRRLALLALPLAVVACGSTARPAAGPRVTLKLSAPADAGTVRAEHVHVQGTVSPAGASVQVDGEAARVNGGAFAADVPLAAGTNVIDVTASAPGRRPDADAVRVTRDMRIEVPDLVGQPSTGAADRLAALGLDSREDRRGSFLDRLFGGARQVCETQPPAHALVDKGTTVTLAVARSC
jgi:hypothetical protein